MFLTTINGNRTICRFSDINPTNRKHVYKIELLSIPGDINSKSERVAEAYTSGIAYRIYKDLLNIYNPDQLVMR